jgi:hypothetical protein
MAASSPAVAIGRWRAGTLILARTIPPCFGSDFGTDFEMSILGVLQGFRAVYQVAQEEVYSKNDRRRVRFFDQR